MLRQYMGDMTCCSGIAACACPCIHPAGWCTVSNRRALQEVGQPFLQPIAMKPCVLPCCMQTETFFYDTGSNINVTDRGQELGYSMAHSLAMVAAHNGDDRYDPALGCHLLCFFITAIQPVHALPHPVIRQTQVDLVACLPTYRTVVGLWANLPRW